jgi:hypothetical protein
MRRSASSDDDDDDDDTVVRTAMGLLTTSDDDDEDDELSSTFAATGAGALRLTITAAVSSDATDGTDWTVGTAARLTTTAAGSTAFRTTTTAGSSGSAVAFVVSATVGARPRHKRTGFGRFKEDMIVVC